MKNADGDILYVGKAANLKRRVSSYFTRPHDVRIEHLVSKIKKIDIQKTDTALEALILEASLIKKYQPPFNIREKDDTSFLFIEITEDPYARVLLVRGKDAVHGERFGPFTSSSSAREALKILMKIFPWGIHPAEDVGMFKRPCFDYELGLCPGTCIGTADIREYRQNIRNLKLFLGGEKKKIIGDLRQKMNEASEVLAFEKAEKYKRQIFALEHIQDIAFINENEISGRHSLKRIEGYDISNISGTSSVGVMVVFENDKPKKSNYRKFKIQTISGPNDVGMMLEVLERRFKNAWPLPDLILVDGGISQVRVAEKIVKEFKHTVPVLGIAKGPERKRNDIFGKKPEWVSEATLIHIRDEAHRFAITFHRKVRSDTLIPKKNGVVLKKKTSVL